MCWKQFMMCLEDTWFVAAFHSNPRHDPGLKEVQRPARVCVCKGASVIPCLLSCCCWRRRLGSDSKVPAEALETARREVTLVPRSWWRPGYRVRTHSRYIGGRVGLVDSAREKDKTRTVAKIYRILLKQGRHSGLHPFDSTKTKIDSPGSDGPMATALKRPWSPWWARSRRCRRT